MEVTLLAKYKSGIDALDSVLRRRMLTRFRVAVDGGAQSGEWTRPLAGLFDHVHAFEPEPMSVAIWEALCGHLKNATLHPHALMDVHGMVDCYPPPRRTATFHHEGVRPRLTSRQVRFNPAGNILGGPLDTLKLENCDLIKFDLEGCEPLALKGARKTIKRCRPVLVIEFNQRVARFASLDQMDKQIVEMGYRLRRKVEIDRIYIPIEVEE
jgi:FkbM family methyltransferase